MAHWPEIHKYFGCCSLNVGVYIKILVDLVYCAAYFFISGIDIAFWINARHFIHEVSIDDLVNANFTQRDINYFSDYFMAMIVYKIVYMVLKIVYVLTVVASIYGLVKKKPKLIKAHLLITILNFFFDCLTGILNTVTNIWVAMAPYLIYLSFQGYNILVISTVYKKMTGKSNLVFDEDDMQTEIIMDAPPNVFVSLRHRDGRSPSSNTAGPPHCTSCTCSLLPRTDHIPTPDSTQGVSPPTPQVSPMSETKDLNLKDVPVIFNQNLLQPGTSSILEDLPIATTSGPSLVTTNDKNGGANTSRNVPVVVIRSVSNSELYVDEKKEKPDLDDMAPVIYDQSQLNTGNSSIFEN